MRIVTLLPSATDIIVSLGLESFLVGVSHECDGYSKRIRRLTSSSIKSTYSSKEIHQNIQDILNYAEGKPEWHHKSKLSKQDIQEMYESIDQYN